MILFGIVSLTPCCIYTHTHTHTGSTVWAERPHCLSDTLHCYSLQMKTRFHLNTSLRFRRLNLVCQSETFFELTCHRGQHQCGLTHTYTHMQYTRPHAHANIPPCSGTAILPSVIDMRGMLTCLLELEPFDCIRYSSSSVMFTMMTLVKVDTRSRWKLIRELSQGGSEEILKTPGEESTICQECL